LYLTKQIRPIEISSRYGMEPNRPPLGSNLATEDDVLSGKKSRKAYTITKQRENWSDEEHQKFLEAIKLYDRDWKKIEKHIGTKTVIQIRSHAQKHFMKVQKNNTGEKVPPPRPKRKSSKPYPQKAKPDEEHPPPSIPQQQPPQPQWHSDVPSPSLPPTMHPTAFAQWMTMNGLLPYSNNMSPQEAIELQRQQQDQMQQAQRYLNDMSQPARLDPSGPNFAKIYTFLGSLFDPNITNQLETLKTMSQIDKDTVQNLMYNLALNVTTQQFREQHMFLLEQYRKLLDALSSSQQGKNALPSAIPFSHPEDSMNQLQTAYLMHKSHLYYPVQPNNQNDDRPL